MDSAPQSIEADTGNVVYPALIVSSNPPQILRWFWWGKRAIATMGRAAVADHSIDDYVSKLAYWAYVRSLPRTASTKVERNTADKIDQHK